MVMSFFQRHLGDTFGFIVGYIPNLIISPILMIVSSLTQPFFWLDYTWGILGTAIGYIGGLGFILMGGEASPRWGKHARIIAPKYLANTRFGGVSLGPIIIGNTNFSDWDHEYGHTWQNRILGPFYLFIIAIPSLISASTRTAQQHHAFYTEKWADAWSGWV